ncbi:MAG TPA: hypothetical protein VE988_09125 [Gemmataceae bacterium]|nr:hypothetical protein [Gemmataceae bacterium]
MTRSLVVAAAASAVFGLVAWEKSSGQAAGEKKPLGVAPEIIRLEPKINQSAFFVFSHDAKLFAYNWDNAIHVFDLKAGKEIQVLGNWPKGGWLERTAISPTGDKLLAAYRTTSASELWLWNLATGTPLHALEYDPSRERLESYDNPLGFCPDGKSAIGVLERGSKWGLQLWDLATGKKMPSFGWDLDGIRGGIRAFRFSEDGKTVVAEHWKHIRDEPWTSTKTQSHYNISMRLWDLESGRDLGRFGSSMEIVFKGVAGKMPGGSFPPESRLKQVGLSTHGYRVRVSPLGRIMVFPRESKDSVLAIKGRTTLLLDFATGQELPWVKQLDEFNVGWAALSPDNRKLAVCGEPKGNKSGQHDQVILLLDVSLWREDALKARKEPTAKELTAISDDLGADEPIKALQALRRMRASPEIALAFLKEQLRPVAYDTTKIPTYIAQIDDANFKAREHAEAELILMGEHAEAALKKALVTPASPEARARLQPIVDMLDKGNWPAPATRRLLWSIEFLERDATPAAVELLERLATGGPEAWVTQEAIASLQRLGKRLRERNEAVTKAHLSLNYFDALPARLCLASGGT